MFNFKESLEKLFAKKQESIEELFSTVIISAYANATHPRPRPWSMANSFISWQGLTDRRWNGRHLPPENQDGMPSVEDLAKLFKRPNGKMQECKRSSVLFMFFAQWFTDSFLRTDIDDPRKTDSNHEVDLCALYGLSEEQTTALRAKGENGEPTHLLASQDLDEGEFPLYLYKRNAAGLAVNAYGEPVKLGEMPEMADAFWCQSGKEQKTPLHSLQKMTRIASSIPGTAEERAKTLGSYFAMGLEHGNATLGYIVINVMFLRAHNRLAEEIKQKQLNEDGSEYAAGWSDERVFQTTRNVMIVILLKLVVEDYIRHITKVRMKLPVGMADNAPWGKPNQIALEFNLLYRWHSLIPDKLKIGQKDDLDHEKFRHAPQTVKQLGLGPLLQAFSAQRAGRIGLLNNPNFMAFRGNDGEPSAIERTLEHMRQAELAPFESYRQHFRRLNILPDIKKNGIEGAKKMAKEIVVELFGSKTILLEKLKLERRKLKSFKELVGDQPNADDIVKLLTEIYGHDPEGVARLDWFIGIFAEPHGDDSIMGDLMMDMVGYDAFTQVLNNPLLCEQIFVGQGEKTFTALGKDKIKAISNIQDLAQYALNDKTVTCGFTIPPETS